MRYFNYRRKPCSILQSVPINALPTSRKLSHQLMFIPIAFIAIGVFIGISQSAGTGGGPILNMCIMMGINSDPKIAMALTYIFLMGGSLASIIQNLWKKREDGSPLTNYVLIQLTLPMTLSGSIMGVMLNHYMSEMMITVLFTLLLSFLSKAAYSKYKESLLLKDEEVDTSKDTVADPLHMLVLPLEGNSETPFEDPIVLSLIDREKSAIPKGKLKHLFYVMVTAIGFLLVRGSPKYPSVVGIPSCGILYWICNALFLLICFGFALTFSIHQFKIQEQNARFGLEQNEGDKLTPKKFWMFMLGGFFAGLAGGSLGLGGSSILIPIWLSLKVDKNVATCSTAPLIFLSAFISFFLSALAGVYSAMEVVQYLALSFFSSFCIKWIIGEITAKYRLKSMVFFLLLFTTLLSLLGLLPFQLTKYLANPAGFMETGELC